MTIETKVVTRLTGYTAITAVVGTRIFPVIVRSDTVLPCITYRRLSGERDYTLAGSLGWAAVRISLTAWAADYATARGLADDMRKALDAYSDGTSDGIQIASVQDGADGYDPDVDVFGCSIEVTVAYAEV